MITDIIVAIACDAIAVLILISGILSAIRDGGRVALTKLLLVLGGGVGTYFLTPVISDKFYTIEGIETVLSKVGGGISVGTINSCIFLILFMLFYAITLITCSIVRHCLIKRLRNKKLNKLKMKRAKSINPHAERMAARAEWKSLKAKYREQRKWYHSLISGFIGSIVAVVVGFVVLMPYGYIAKDINYKGDKEYLVKGYEYTLNGVIPDEVSDFLVHAEVEVKEDEVPEVEVPVCEHTYEEGVCTSCGAVEEVPEAPLE